MHGVKRTHLSAQLREQKRQQDSNKIATYRRLNEQILALREAHDYSLESLAKNSQLLALNPEYYSAWNYRREILLALMAALADVDFVDLFNRELHFTLLHLKRFPKCYWIWNHRVWVLQHFPDIPSMEITPALIAKVWQTELAIVAKLLEQDSRNFHGWHYRRFVTGQMAALATDHETGAARVQLANIEFEYTTQKINANLSNYSAWHQRSKLVPQLLLSPPPGSLFERPSEFLTTEIAYLTNAMYTDAADSSHWLYLHWLLCELLPTMPEAEQMATLVKVQGVVEELNELEVEDDGVDNKWCLVCMGWIKKEMYRIGGDKGKLVEEMLVLVAKLVEIDPMRKGRWEDLVGSIGVEHEIQHR
ncbi:hypothetical protein BABINDRAFT_165666 [Babjeviella inositovora NRRL Y-12698]|uniref:Geranylgeranyl transferase type-2 subunit alpha n=1 Tax=Babjeviella inositovora NRRL Y-12698 TaxID=984486 RepID=A0A1E3QT74_9ASCO|nr:uncharacterized protein BABINDRAFT_165666 [Babjeviella inositovora NRRL Y-12698]ODQ80913.1 hypothetical protein BABINDRAFT_165666 [Babjeviella inositovora NRRL Y-12698]